MEIIFSPQSLEDLNFWKKSGNTKVQQEFKNFWNQLKKILMKVLVSQKHSNIIGQGIGQDVLTTSTGLFINGKMKK